MRLRFLGRLAAADAPHTPCFDALTAHSDMVSLDSALSNDGPARCSVLAGNAWTPVQAMAIQYMGGEFWGVQYHPEFDLAEAARLMQVASPLLLDQGTFQTQSDIEDYASQMLELAQDPARLDLRLRLGIDDDVSAIFAPTNLHNEVMGVGWGFGDGAE
jgi:GMP synthase (glutamine-hydrolysing)